MTLSFQKIPRGKYFPSPGQSNTVYLRVDNWDDYSFKTLFDLALCDENGETHEIGNVKIGYFGQPQSATHDSIPDVFKRLDENFFSLGQDAEYYKKIKELLSQEFTDALLVAMRDVAYDDNLLSAVEQEEVFKTSLMRSISWSAIHGQYKRILSGGAILTEFLFSYKRAKSELNTGIEIDFHVTPNSKPPTNIHILIGRNGVGKTTLLNNMVKAVLFGENQQEDRGLFYDISSWYLANKAISDEYFSSVVSVAFSAFDPFIPPLEQHDRNKGTCYFYIGLKNIFEENGSQKTKLKEPTELCEDFICSLGSCFSLQKKKELWLRAISKLESDSNFSYMELMRLAEEEYPQNLAESLYKRMSSGHAIVLLTMTRLVETVEEKTLVLLDEPESHLHPPLLSAFTRALSDLLINRNAVAIIATHSPVVLQEVPKSCVWKLRRTGLDGQTERPEAETFGENVGVLTREVFGLEVSKSGFHELLLDSVEPGKSYEEILAEFDNQLGFEGRAILRALIATKDVKEND